MSGYVYPGTRGEFAAEFGGLPESGLGLRNIFIVFIIVIIVIIIVTAIAFLRAQTKTATINHTGFYNLDTLIDANNATTQCCVFPGTSAPNEQYIYDTVNNITYSRQKPTDINIVCNTFPNPTVCIADNTDGQGNIIPRVTFAAQPYYTFENGLFVGCDSTTVC
jgi:hypothetical protein